MWVWLYCVPVFQSPSPSPSLANKCKWDVNFLNSSRHTLTWGLQTTVWSAIRQSLTEWLGDTGMQVEMLMLLVARGGCDQCDVSGHIVSDEQSQSQSLSLTESHWARPAAPALDTLQIYVGHGQFGQLLSHLNIVQPGDNNLYVWKNILCKLNEQSISGQSAHLWFMSVSCSSEIWFLFKLSSAKLEPRQLSVYSPRRDSSPSEFLQKVR